MKTNQECVDILQKYVNDSTGRVVLIPVEVMKNIINFLSPSTLTEAEIIEEVKNTILKFIDLEIGKYKTAEHIIYLKSHFHAYAGNDLLSLMSLKKICDEVFRKIQRGE